jgi:anti-sigma factor ChrR (cupin superfamily)
MRAGSLDDVLRRLDAPEAARPEERPQPHPPEALAACELPLPLLEFICGCPQAVLRWRRVTNGWEILAVPTACPQTQVTLVRAVPGARAPARAGRGGMRLVLQGGWVEQAQRHPAGTLLVYGEEPCEDAAACRSDGCLCLVVDEGAPAPGGWGALFRRFFS